jgi:hypothetical protein
VVKRKVIDPQFMLFLFMINSLSLQLLVLLFFKEVELATFQFRPMTTPRRSGWLKGSPGIPQFKREKGGFGSGPTTPNTLNEPLATHHYKSLYPLGSYLSRNR